VLCGNFEGGLPELHLSIHHNLGKAFWPMENTKYLNQVFLSCWVRLLWQWHVFIFCLPGTLFLKNMNQPTFQQALEKNSIKSSCKRERERYMCLVMLQEDPWPCSAHHRCWTSTGLEENSHSCSCCKTQSTQSEMLDKRQEDRGKGRYKCTCYVQQRERSWQGSSPTSVQTE
jgi:hypothetical protein